MKTALGLDDVNRFPYQLSPLKTKKRVAYPHSGFYRSSAKPQENIQEADKNLCHTRFFLCGEVQVNI